MNKNIIKQHLSKTFISEDTAHKATSETKKVQDLSGATNKAAMNNVAKEMKEYDKSSKESEKENADSVKKYENDSEQDELHDLGELQNGSLAATKVTSPSDKWQEMQDKAISGTDSTLGNSKDYANVVTADQAGFTGPEFGENLVKNIKKSKKLRAKAEDKYNRLSTGVSGADFNDKKINEVKNLVKEGLSEKGLDTLKKWIDDLDYRKAGIKLIDSALNKTIALSSSDMGDTEIFADGLDTVEELLIAGEYNKAFDTAKETAKEMATDEFGTLTAGIKHFNENKVIKKEKMKRLVFNKPFNGVTNALNLIPESYKINNKEFHMTDGDEKYEIRWEGNLNEGKAIITKASDKTIMNENMVQMKHLMGYKSEDTLGNLKGYERINENASFNDILNKTKRLLSEDEKEVQRIKDYLLKKMSVDGIDKKEFLMRFLKGQAPVGYNGPERMEDRTTAAKSLLNALDSESYEENQTLNESRYGEYLENTLFQKLEDEKGVGRGSDEGNELVKNVLKPFEAEMNNFRKFITKRYNNPDENEVKRNLKGQIERIVKGGNQLGVEEDVTMNAIVGQIYLEFFERGSNSFTRLYEANHVKFMLKAVKEVLEEVLKELQFNDEKFSLISRIDRYLNL
jgi:hypothetical protein